MENLSILKLFTSAVKADSSKLGSSSASSSSSSNSTRQATGADSAFEDVFKSYLDKTDSSSNVQIEKSDAADQAKQVVKAVKATASKASSADSDSQQAQDPKTPEEVIDSMNVPDEVKDELKQMLSEIKTEDDAQQFMQQLMAIMQSANMTVEDVETTLTDLASTLLDGTSEIVPQTAVPALTEQVLNALVDIQKSQADPKQLFVMPEPEKKDGQQTDDALLDQTADDNQTQQAQQAVQTAEDTTETTAADIKTDKPEEKQAEADVKPEKTEKADSTDVQTDDNVVDLAAKRTENASSNSDSSGDYTAKTPFTEKVITTEIKIEKPQDIAKFAELVEIAKTQNASKIHVQLNPVELGKVSIELTETAGKITGKVTFESESAKNLFASNIENFKQQLAEKGIQVENLEFLFKDFDQHQFAGWDNKQNKGGGTSAGGTDASYTDDESEQEESDDSIIYA